MNESKLLQSLLSRLNVRKQMDQEILQITAMLNENHVDGCSMATCDGPCSCPNFKEIIGFMFKENLQPQKASRTEFDKPKAPHEDFER
jgi:hypothetical protein